jgi:hypothetical protein
VLLAGVKIACIFLGINKDINNIILNKTAVKQRCGNEN